MTTSQNHPYPAPQAPQPTPPVPPPKSDKAKIILLSVLGVIIGLVVLGSCVSLLSGSEPATVETTAADPVPRAGERNPDKPAPPKASASAVPKPTKKALTKSQEQAIGSAKGYLEYTAFSRKGLIHQLSSDAGEGFSKADAMFAVDYLKVNWNEQAAKSAKSYLEYSHFSRKGLIHQLESDAGEGFTHSQAVYGVKKAGL